MNIFLIHVEKNESSNAFIRYYMCVFPFRVLQLMNLTDSRLAQAGNERLELAMLSFFEQFRKIYIGDQVQKSSKVNAAFRLYSYHRVDVSSMCSPPLLLLSNPSLSGGKLDGNELIFCPERRGVCCC